MFGLTTSLRTASRSAASVVSRPSPATARIAPRAWSAARCYSAAPDAKAAGAEGKKDGGEDAAAEVLKKVNELESTVKDLKSQLTYGKADFINLQRRSEQEKSSTRDFAIQSFASDLLSTIDILSTALKYVPQPIPAENTALASLFSGVDMTRRELLKVLAKHGVTPFDPTGERFDPNLHEAMFQAPVPGKEPGTVLETQKIGYMIKNRTLRPAQVGVVQETS